MREELFLRNRACCIRFIPCVLFVLLDVSESIKRQFPKAIDEINMFVKRMYHSQHPHDRLNIGRFSGYGLSGLQFSEYGRFAQVYNIEEANSLLEFLMTCSLH